MHNQKIDLLNRKKLIVVIGMHRSGTSAITRGLQIMGVQLGDRLMPAVVGDNDKGYWEDIDINSLNTEILKSINKTWDSLALITHNEIKLIYQKGYFDRAVNLLNKKIGDYANLGLKDPIITILLPFWKNVFEYLNLDVKYILAIRHPFSVAKSLEKRCSFEIEKSFLLWMAYVINGLTETNEENRIIIDYDNFMQDTENKIKNIANIFKLEINSKELEIYKNDFLDNSLRHTFYSIDDLISNSASSSLLKDIYLTINKLSTSINNDNKLIIEKTKLWNNDLINLNLSLILSDKLYNKISDLNSLFEEYKKQIINLDHELNTNNELRKITEIELNQKNKDLKQIQEEFNDKKNEINIKNKELNDKNKELNEKIVQLNQMYSSRSWKITKPLRIFIKLLKNLKNKYIFLRQILITAKKRHGSIKTIIIKTYNTLKNEGIKGCIIQIKKHSYYTIEDQNLIYNISKKLTLNTIIPESLIKYKPQNTILFIGHDALLAGAQILLLSLIKWIHENTSINVKIILLRNGILYDKFNEIAPTLIWEDIKKAYPEHEKRNEFLKEYTENVSLIYGNTILSPVIYDELNFIKAPYITHIHELEKSIRLYVDNSILQQMYSTTNTYIACSKPVEDNLLKNHNINKNNIITIYEFIDDKKLNINISKKELRTKLNLNEKDFIVISCGTMYWRKGVDLFIETAIQLKQKGVLNFHFYWIGENFWDYDNESCLLSSWAEIVKKIQDYELQNAITFLGVKENVMEYFMASDVFYLASREDPFPLVCLEAAQCGIPIICFKDAGGMPEFVENDAGFVVDFENSAMVADKIDFLINNRDKLIELGNNARTKFFSRHCINIAAPKILNVCREIANISPLVSIIIPNYNYSQFIKKRIDSILDQTFKDFEIIILDDASTDNSIEIIEKYLNFPNIKFIKNEINSGNPFKQWYKGFLEAKGDIIWFAEADDYSEPDFLKKLLPSFKDYSVALSYCDSYIINETDEITGDYKSYLEKLDSNHWETSYIVNAQKEINFGLGVKNSIPNASAVLIRKNCINKDIFENTFEFSFSGDWYFYTQIVKGNKISFNSEKLNYHRKHNQTITSVFNSNKADILLKEAEIIHKNITESYILNNSFLSKWEYYINEQIKALYPNAINTEFNKYYPYSRMKEIISESILKTINSKKLIFITTNDGSPNGGSEQLWKQAVIACQKKQNEVAVVIKDWHPTPSFINEFTLNGIEIIFKNDIQYQKVKDFKPDLVILSLGDQDEGTEWYNYLSTNNIPYVIINQLTKEPVYWPIRKDINEKVKQGYLGAKTVYFTGNNNHLLMEKRLNCKIPNFDICYNPYDVEINTNLAFPSLENGLKLAMPANLLCIHKGQHLAIELLNMKKWRDRSIHLSFYGKGDDEFMLKQQVQKAKLTNITFHGHTNNILNVWKEHHAILLTSYMEGLPLVLVGAMICGRVPIVTDIGAHMEVIDDNICGFIAAKPTVESLDEAMERAYQQSENWDKIGKKARENILKFLPINDPVDDFINKIMKNIN